MTSIRVTRAHDVAAAPGAVWTLLADLAGLARWAPNVDHSSVISERVEGVGAVRRVQVGRLVLVERIDTWEEGSMLGYAIEGLPPVVAAAHNNWMLRAASIGTSVTVITDVVTGGGARRLAGRLVATRLGDASEAMLSGIARHFEEVSA